MNKNTGKEKRTVHAELSMFSFKARLEIASYLRDLGSREIEPKKKYDGICHSFKYYIILNYPSINSMLYYSIIRRYSARWSKVSIDINYPVHTDLSMSPKEQFYLSHSKRKSIWDARTKYGKARLELCLFIAHEMTMEVEEECRAIEEKQGESNE